MLEFNGQRFAETEREVTESLFDPRGSVAGKAKRKASAIELFALNGQLQGCITRNGIVASATRQPDGKVWYSYGWPAIAGPELGLCATRDAIEALAISRTFNMARGETHFRFR